MNGREQRYFRVTNRHRAREGVIANYRRAIAPDAASYHYVVINFALASVGAPTKVHGRLLTVIEQF